MAPERKFYQKIKRAFSNFSLIRLENNSLHGTPDLLVCNNNGHFFTIELKVSKGKKVRLSPHQIAFHVKHPKNTFILVEHKDKHLLFEGHQSLALVDSGLSSSLEPVASSLEDSVSFLSSLGG